MLQVLTEIHMPGRMPALNILPFKQSCEGFPIDGGNSSTCQFDLFLSKNPDRRYFQGQKRGKKNEPIGFCSGR